MPKRDKNPKIDLHGVRHADVFNEVDKFISDNKLLFVKFSSGIYSWPKAHAAVLNLLEKKDKS